MFIYDLFIYRVLFILLLHILSGQTIVIHILHIVFANHLTVIIIIYQTVHPVVVIWTAILSEVELIFLILLVVEQFIY